MIDAALSAAAFALTAGVVTFFSPCAYPLLPGYVGFYVSQTEGDEASLGGALGRGLIAGAGVLVTYAALIGASFWIGHSTLSNVVVFEPLVGALLLVFGVLVALDRAPTLSVALPRRRSSVLGFGVFGAGYALAAAGCVAPVFVGVVSYSMTLPFATGAVAVGTYVGSVVALMVALTVATGMGVVAGGGWFARNAGLLERLAGVLMAVAGVGQLYYAIVVLNAI